MDKFDVARQVRKTREAFLDEIFDRFYIVIRCVFDLFDARSVFDTEVSANGLDLTANGGVLLWQLGKFWQLREVRKPREFDPHAIPLQCELADNCGQMT